MLDQFAALLPYMLPIVLGWAASYLTALLTKSHLASGWKLVLNGVLTVIAAAVATVPYATTGDVVGDLKAYAVALVLAGVANALTYLQGGPQVIERATWNFGIGRKVTGSAQMGQFADVDRSGQPE